MARPEMSASMPTAFSSFSRYVAGARPRRPRARSRCCETSCLISLYLRGWSVWNARSSSSHLIAWMPSRCASGAKISSVSRAFSCCFYFGIAPIVRMLWRRSASLIRMTRMSLGHRDHHLAVVLGLAVVAALERDARSASSRRRRAGRSRRRTRSVTSSSEALVSSTVSWSSAAHSVAVSSRMPAQIFATPTGWVMKSSPDSRALVGVALAGEHERALDRSRSISSRPRRRAPR